LDNQMTTYNSFVTGRVTETVTIGSTSYPNPLEVTSTGYIMPTTATAGIDGAGAGQYTLGNDGSINGGQSFTATGTGGIGVDLSSAIVTNNQTISGGNGYFGSNGGVGVSMAGTLTNSADAVIEGGEAYNGSGTGGLGVVFSGGTLTNDAGAQIIGGGIGFGYGTAATGNGGGGVDLGTDATVKNYGSIEGGFGPATGTKSHPDVGAYGLKAAAPTDIVTNYGGGRVTGGNGYTTGGAGIVASGAATVINDPSGLIYGGVGEGSGTSGAGVQLSGFASLTNDGKIQGGIAPGLGAGGAGVTMASGATVDDQSTIYGGTGFGGNGVGVYLNGGTLVVAGEVSGGIGGAAGNADSVEFGSAAGKITVDSGAKFVGDIGGFAIGDKVDIENLTYYSGARTDLTRDAGGYSLTTPNQGTLQFDGSFSNEHFVFLPDVSTGTYVELVADAACYLRGTRIRTTRGEVPIEALSISDRVVCRSGSTRPVRWLGHRSIDCSRYPEPDSVWPICIRAGALADQQPLRDLWVSPGHAVLVDGVLIQAYLLVNDVTVVRVPRNRVEYWHVELDAHDLLLAEGLAAESYLDTGNRTAFVNGGTFLEAYPDFRARHCNETCLPLAIEGPSLEQARARVQQRAYELGYAITDETDVHVIADGERIDPVVLSDTRVAFNIPAGRRAIELRCHTFVPSSVDFSNPDGRTLGLCVGRLQIDGTDWALEDEPRYAEGWHALEKNSEFHHRWSLGRAPLPAATRLVVIDVAGRSYCWQEPQQVVALCG
jgi:Hint domain